jgi:hypothetical protein
LPKDAKVYCSEVYEKEGREVYEGRRESLVMKEGGRVFYKGRKKGRHNATRSLTLTPPS